jgi:DNA topoisomerase-1
MKLVIVESPAKIKKIESILGPDYKVIASYGHIMDLTTSGTFGLGIDLDTFTPLYKPLKGKEKIIKTINDQANKATEIYIATDPDREGEAIAYHINQVIENKDAQIYRAVFNEITEDAIMTAINNPIDINYLLVESQEARRMLDRIIGFRLSMLTNRKLNAKSAGRVKSSTLKLIIDRERERALFVSAK